MMENCTTGHGRLLPEQVWDADDIPALELFRGKPSGSACPLVWAHSEYIKLRRSLRDGKIFDQPPQTVQRYLVEKPTRQIFGWRFNNKTRSVPRYKKLRLVILRLPPSCTGVSTTGKLLKIQTPATPASTPTSSTCPPPRYPPAAKSSSLSIGRRKIAGKARTTRSRGMKDSPCHPAGSAILAFARGFPTQDLCNSAFLIDGCLAKSLLIAGKPKANTGITLPPHSNK